MKKTLTPLEMLITKDKYSSNSKANLRFCQRRNLSLTGLTLTEVIVSAVILSVVFAGLLATFIGVRKYAKRANQRLVATNLVNFQFSNLYKEVRANDWDTGNLRIHTFDLPDDYDIDNTEYGTDAVSTYNVENHPDAAITDLRKVTVTMDYIE